VHSAIPIAIPGLTEDGLNFVVFGSVAFSLLMALLFAVTRGSESMYDHIGQGGLSNDAPPGSGPSPPAPDSPAGRVEREREIRQMLGARNDRLVRSGQPALDIDAELARLLTPSEPDLSDAGITEEVRQLVVARNERRVRKGEPALDVEAEIARTLQELTP
jgi:hypothetical protein